MKQTFTVSGMSCENCSAHVEKAVKSLSGIQSVQVSLETNSMVVDFDTAAVDANTIIAAVEEEGYGAQAAI